MPSTRKPQVTRVTMPRDNDSIVHVEFNDGHKLVFVEQYAFMRAPIMHLEAVWIEKGGKTCVVFHSKHQYPANRLPFGFKMTTEGWTAERFAAYWKAALEYIDAAHAKKRLTKAWRVATCGRTDLEEIMAGAWKMPAPR